MLMIVSSSSNLLIVYESLRFAAKRGDYHSSGPEKNDRQMACHVLWSTGGSKVGLQHSELKPHPRETPFFFQQAKNESFGHSELLFRIWGMMAGNVWVRFFALNKTCSVN